MRHSPNFNDLSVIQPSVKSNATFVVGGNSGASASTIVMGVGDSTDDAPVLPSATAITTPSKANLEYGSASGEERGGTRRFSPVYGGRKEAKRAPKAE